MLGLKGRLKPIFVDGYDSPAVNNVDWTDAAAAEDGLQDVTFLVDPGVVSTSPAEVSSARGATGCVLALRLDVPIAAPQTQEHRQLQAMLSAIEGMGTGQVTDRQLVYRSCPVRVSSALLPLRSSLSPLPSTSFIYLNRPLQFFTAPQLSATLHPLHTLQPRPPHPSTLLHTPPHPFTTPLHPVTPSDALASLHTPPPSFTPSTSCHSPPHK